MMLCDQTVLAYLSGEPAADQIEEMLRDRAVKVKVSARTIADVTETLRADAGHDPVKVASLLAGLCPDHLEIVDLHGPGAVLGIHFRWKYLDEEGKPRLSVAAANVLGVTKGLNDDLATTNPVLAEIAEDIKLRVTRLRSLEAVES